jgi:hypothetical protein
MDVVKQDINNSNAQRNKADIMGVITRNSGRITKRQEQKNCLQESATTAIKKDISAKTVGI